MICKRCGSECPKGPEGYCLHCLVAVGIDKATDDAISKGVIGEGFPNWRNPNPLTEYSIEELEAEIDRRKHT